jgi:hypothetical protein
LTTTHLDRATAGTTHKQSREGATHKRPLEEAEANLRESVRTNKHRRLHDTRPGKPGSSPTLMASQDQPEGAQIHRDPPRNPEPTSTNSCPAKGTMATAQEPDPPLLPSQGQEPRTGDPARPPDDVRRIGGEPPTVVEDPRQRGGKCSSHSCVKCKGKKAEDAHDFNNLSCAELELIESRKRSQTAPPPPPRHDAQANISEPASPSAQPTQTPPEDTPPDPLTMRPRKAGTG